MISFPRGKDQKGSRRNRKSALAVKSNTNLQGPGKIEVMDPLTVPGDLISYNCRCTCIFELLKNILYNDYNYFF